MHGKSFSIFNCVSTVYLYFLHLLARFALWFLRILRERNFASFVSVLLALWFCRLTELTDLKTALSEVYFIFYFKFGNCVLAIQNCTFLPSICLDTLHTTQVG